MRLLVTGTTSLLGGETTRRLIEAGHDVRGFQQRESGGACDEVLGDIVDPIAVRRAVDGMEGIVHLAARVGTTGSWDEYERVNVTGTVNLIAAAKDAGIERLVYVSSPSVAHTGSSLIGAPAGSADPGSARSNYARSKAMAERAALDARTDTFAVVAIRPHLVWGPGDSQLVGRIVERARRGRLAIIGSGTALIDTTYVGNAADALVAAVERCEIIDGRSLVVSNGQPRPVSEILNRIVTAAGLEPVGLRVPTAAARYGGVVAERFWERSGRSGEPPMTRFVAEQLSTAHWFDQRETRSALRWTPAVSLDEGFARLRRWFDQTTQ